MRPGLIALAHVARHTRPALLSLDNSRTPDGMRSLHAPAVSRNVERSADETAEGSHNCGEVVALIGSEPTKLDQRVDRAALDFEHEADFARRTQRRAYSHLERPLDKIDQRMREGAPLSQSDAVSQPRSTRSAVTFGPTSRLTMTSPCRRRSRDLRMRSAADDSGVIFDPHDHTC